MARMAKGEKRAGLREAGRGAKAHTSNGTVTVAERASTTAISKAPAGAAREMSAVDVAALPVGLDVSGLVARIPRARVVAAERIEERCRGASRPERLLIMAAVAANSARLGCV